MSADSLFPAHFETALETPNTLHTHMHTPAYSRSNPLSGAEGRAFLRSWLTDNGVKSALANSLTMSDLNSAWTDQTDATLEALRTRTESAPTSASGDRLALRSASSLMLEALSLVQTQASLDETRVIELIRQHSKPSEIRYSFTFPFGTTHTERREHSYFPLIVAALQSGTHVWLVGPAGSGKTSLVSAAAKLLGRESRSMSVCAQTTKTDLLGFIDANGTYRSTAFREAFEKGFVFCLDEADNGNPNVLAVLNSALANGELTFPDCTVKRGEGFVCIAAANTWGQGATGGYVGRNQIDAATLDRFFFLHLPLDEGLEASFLGVEGIPSPSFDLSEGGVPTAEQWLRIVQSARAAAESNGIKAVISPRASLMGARLASLGVGLSWLLKGLIIKSLPSDSASKLVS